MSTQASRDPWGLIPEDQPGATHVWVVVVPGLSVDGSLDLGFAELPNWHTIQRLGLRVDRCWLNHDSRRENLRDLLFTPDQPLSQAAAAAGRKVVQVLPLRDDRWVADETTVPHWSIIEEKLDVTTRDWMDLGSGKPQFISRGPVADDDNDYFHYRILGRFPGIATQLSGIDALSAWMKWAADAFLRSVWYASARADKGVFGLLVYPAPVLFQEHFGESGYERGMDLTDELLGRLMQLRENPEMSDSVVVVCSDQGYAAPGAEDDESPPVPVLVIGPSIDEGLVVEDAGVSEVAQLVQHIAGSAVTG